MDDRLTELWTAWMCVKGSRNRDKERDGGHMPQQHAAFRCPILLLLPLFICFSSLFLTNFFSLPFFPTPSLPPSVCIWPFGESCLEVNEGCKASRVRANEFMCVSSGQHFLSITLGGTWLSWAQIYTPDTHIHWAPLQFWVCECECECGNQSCCSTL